MCVCVCTCIYVHVYMYSFLVSVERACWPCIRCCTLPDSKSIGPMLFIDLSSSLSFCLLSFYGLSCGAGVFGLIGVCRHLKIIMYYHNAA